MKKIAIIITLAFLIKPIFIHAQELQINSIPMKDFIGKSNERDIPVFDNEVSNGRFDSVPNTFFIDVTGNDYAKSRKVAENNFLSALGLTKNESCFLNSIFKATNENYSEDDLKNFSDQLSFCSSPTQQDLNTDDVVNGVDFAQCVADYDTSDEAEKAFDKLTKRETFTLSTGQSLESLYELDLPCDFNVNRRIDALDLSKVIDAIGISASDQE